LILGLGKFGPQSNCSFIKSKSPGQLSFGMSVLAALKKFHGIRFAVRRIVCLSGREWEAQGNRQ
jgi:hypothetical protein